MLKNQFSAVNRILRAKSCLIETDPAPEPCKAEESYLEKGCLVLDSIVAASNFLFTAEFIVLCLLLKLEVLWLLEAVLERAY